MKPVARYHLYDEIARACFNLFLDYTPLRSNQVMGWTSRALFTPSSFLHLYFITIFGSLLSIKRRHTILISLSILQHGNAVFTQREG